MKNLKIYAFLRKRCKKQSWKTVWEKYISLKMQHITE